LTIRVRARYPGAFAGAKRLAEKRQRKSKFMPVFGLHPPDLLQTVVEDIGVAMLVINREERVVFANKMALQLFDVTTAAEGARFRDFRSKIRLEDSSGNEIHLVQGMVIRVLKNEPVESQEARLLKANGETKWLMIRVYRFSCLGVDGVAVFVEDETTIVEIRKAAALREKMETIGTVAAELTHDFNNVLNTITINTSLAREIGGYSSQVGDCIDQISDAVNKSAGLIQRLMQLGRQDLHLRALDVNDVVRNVVRLTQSLLRENIDLTLDLQEDLPAVYGDSSQLERVLVNLIVNALEAMPDGGDLTIATHVPQRNQTASVEKEPVGQEKERVVQISVRDAGTGIPVDIQSSIFQPFFTTKSGGTGLGLSSAFRIIRQHGGRIGVDSLPGIGATFTVSLPVHDPVTRFLSEDFAKAS
jgi:signal transduction histidine kinase